MLDTRVKDWSTEHGGSPGRLSYRSLFISMGRFVLCAAAIWAFLFWAQKTLPYVQNGAAAVAYVKLEFAQSSNMFGLSDHIRVVSFGNSKMLSGFKPFAFDAALGPKVEFCNLAIPGDDKFVDLLETVLSHGDAPTHVFVQWLPHSEPNLSSIWTALLDNKKVVNLLFPFRDFVRDALIFSFQARAAGGPI